MSSENNNFLLQRILTISATEWFNMNPDKKPQDFE